MAHSHNTFKEENFEFTGSLKQKLFIAFGIGILLFVLGLFFTDMSGGSHGREAAGHEMHSTEVTHDHAGKESAHHGPTLMKRVWVNLWMNNVYFTGMAVIGVFFFAVQYAANAGWSASITRIMHGPANYLPFGAVVAIIIFAVGGHDIFHWTHESLYIKTLEDGVTPNPEYDRIIDGKKPFLNIPFYMTRMVLYYAVWYFMYTLMRKQSLIEDGSKEGYHKMIKYCAIFLVFFAVTSSTSAWDWILSIDTHWFSTMFGWYTFASWFVSGLAAITLAIVLLKKAGYLSYVNSNHLHDLGKFMFAFSIFWTYIWFSQFLLIYYANIPEESVYFVERLYSFGGHYRWIFFVNIFANFVFPFLALMTRDAKRQLIILQIVCTVILLGHWLDFYLMMMPGTLQGYSGFGFLEFGGLLMFGSVFVYLFAHTLSKAPLAPKNHPMLEESLHHVVY